MKNGILEITLKTVKSDSTSDSSLKEFTDAIDVLIEKYPDANITVELSEYS